MSRLMILDQPRKTAPPLGPALAGPPALDESASGTRLVDAFGRRLTYLRVSVTDRCNLRCAYCLPEDAEFPFGDRDFLSPEEIETMVGALVRLGIRRVRLTGGEPLVRKDLLEIVRRLKALPGLENLALSTNGTELARAWPRRSGRPASTGTTSASTPSTPSAAAPSPAAATWPRSGAASRRRSPPGSIRSSSTPSSCRATARISRGWPPSPSTAPSTCASSR